MTTTRVSAQLRVRQHAAGERLLLKALAGFFKSQAKTIGDAFKTSDDIVPSMVAQIFDATGEHELLMAAIRDPIVKIMATGAETQLRLAEKLKPGKSKAADDVAAALDKFELPDDVRHAIAASFDELAEQPYWMDIQTTTSAKLTAVIQGGLDEGLNGWAMRKRIGEALGELSKIRAAAIARTETTAAYNSGHQTVYDALAATGAATGKTWIAGMDKDTRESHAALDGVTVGVNDDFDVGGSPAPYPGHWSLPAAERVNCRCTTVAELSDAIQQGEVVT